MKDFYDIYYLTRTFDFDGAKLQTAILEPYKGEERPMIGIASRELLRLPMMQIYKNGGNIS